MGSVSFRACLLGRRLRAPLSSPRLPGEQGGVRCALGAEGDRKRRACWSSCCAVRSCVPCGMRARSAVTLVKLCDCLLGARMM